MNGISIDENKSQEISDNLGSTVAYTGTATTSVQNVPSVADKVISGFGLTVSGNNVQISVDGGTTFFNVPRRGSITWDVKGEIQQLQIKTSFGSTDFDLLINFEDF
jgi:hypothetical protein